MDTTNSAQVTLMWQMFKKLLFYVFLFMLLIPVVFVFYWMVATSLKTQLQNISYPPQIFDFDPTLTNYSDLLRDTDYLSWTMNSFIVAVGATGLGLLFGLPMAYSVARYRQHVLGIVVLIARMGPGISFTVPWFIIFSRLNLLDKYPSLILTYTTLTLPLIVWMMTSFFEDLPEEIEDSARIDGCSTYGVFYRIALPLTRPGVAAAGILSFIFAWNQFLFPLVLAGNNTRTLPIAISTFVQLDMVNWGELAAAVTLVNVPVLLIALLVQGQLVTGLTFGAVKG